MTHTFAKLTFQDYERALKTLRDRRVAAAKAVERCRENLATAEHELEAIDTAIVDSEHLVAYMTFANLQAGATDTAEASPEVTR